MSTCSNRSFRDPNKDEAFILYTCQDDKMTVFCAESELKVSIFCSTFEMSPTSAYELYTLHGVVNGEGMVLLWVLLPGNTTDTHNEMLCALRQALNYIVSFIPIKYPTRNLQVSHHFLKDSLESSLPVPFTKSFCILSYSCRTLCVRKHYFRPWPDSPASHAHT